MFRMPRLVASVVALSIASLALPALAKEGNGDGKARVEERKGDRDKHFPMKSKEFSEKLEKRLTKVKARITKKVEKAKLTEAEKTKVMNEVDAGAKAVRAAAEAAGKDGTITKEEAKDIRTKAKDARKKIIEAFPRDKRPAGKGEKGKA